jgi:N-acetylneuraminate synthase
MISKKATYIIAEAGVNHNGSIELAKKLIDTAADAGADAVKFQTFKADKVVCERAFKAKYQMDNTDSTESQLVMIRKLELSESDHKKLQSYCIDKGITFISTPFDEDSLIFLNKTLNLPCIKIPSGEITNAPFLLKIAQTGKPVILSTGMSTLSEVEAALGVLAFGYLMLDEHPSTKAFACAYSGKAGQTALKDNVTLLHCTTEYPAPYKDVNLRAMLTLGTAFNLPTGLSDHTEGYAVAVAAVALGAKVIEKHFTMDKNLPGPDHKASLEPDELKAMVAAIRQVEVALGSPIKAPTESELKNLVLARKSLVAAKPIKKDEPFAEMNLTAKRPGDGLSPFLYWDILGSCSNKNYNFNDSVLFKDIFK